ECRLITHVDDLAEPSEKVCPRCGGELQQREDDAPEAVRQRLVEYTTKTRPLLQYYREAGLLHTVDGSGTVDAVAERVAAVVESAGTAQQP
ncbi:MAG: adenylate kinase family protein, partial [Armatimonadota bacterium]